MLPLACLKQNVNYPSGDVNHCDTLAWRAEACQDLCQKNERCQSFTWIGDKKSWDYKRCCMKYWINPTPVYDNANKMVSGPKFRRGILIIIIMGKYKRRLF